MKFGTHNLHDTTGVPTPFADVIVFTESIPRRIKIRLEPLGYGVVVCREQQDLVIAYKKGSAFKRSLRPARYHLVHGGIAKVTPHRGTFWLNGTLNGKPAIVIAEHRINAAFPPYIRGEAEFRRKKWDEHTDWTCGLIRRAKADGKIVLAAGDLNTIPGVDGYRGLLKERGAGFDRLGGSGVEVGPRVYMTRMGSDHKRLLANISF